MMKITKLNMNDLGFLWVFDSRNIMLGIDSVTMPWLTSNALQAIALTIVVFCRNLSHFGLLHYIMAGTSYVFFSWTCTKSFYMRFYFAWATITSAYLNWIPLRFIGDWCVYFCPEVRLLKLLSINHSSIFLIGLIVGIFFWNRMSGVSKQFKDSQRRPLYCNRSPDLRQTSYIWMSTRI